jgi:hypothetical protein
MTSFTGGCVCGAVRYEVKSPPISMFKCHCRTCQMSTGSGYTPVVLVLRKAFHLTQGTLSHYETNTIQEGKNKRGFCGICGSRLTGAETDRWLGITASSLDDPTLFKPQFDIFASHAQPWDVLDPTSTKYPEYQGTRA